ncbi:PAS domain-containing protein [Shinella daejeonensis]|uniref:helix-turn-helix transcriptional regulator n=1 Tax=Shinella daejeonensis TaxID=659017 RepID=UPI0020C8265E|nr:PAS domain-containing protein [Shinella daejeonensis]MCP8893702.1 PAS domain-containing protein [Shinella daejeonensis]
MTSKTSESLLKVHGATAAAVAALLDPHGEVVLHDLATGRIAGLWNAFSGRKPGMESLVEPDFTGASAVLGPYEKTEADGRKIKSVTAVLRDGTEQPVGLLCINLDVSRFDAAAALLAAFVGAPAPRPALLFSGDWRAAIDDAVHVWLRAEGLSLPGLRRDDRVALTAALDTRGLFHTRNAVDHLAALLGVSRASIYNYLADARRMNDKDRTP